MIKIDAEEQFNVATGVVAVKFEAEWCAPCKTMAPNIHKLENEFGAVKFISVDIDELPEIAQKLGVRSIPTLVIFKDGKEQRRIVGMAAIDPLRKVFREVAA